MIHNITVNKDTKESNILFFSEINLDNLPNPRIVPLFGANGAGKTTLLKALETTPGYLREIEYYRQMQNDVDEAEGSLLGTIKSMEAKEAAWEWQYWEDEIETVKKKIPLILVRDDGKDKILKYRNSDDNFRTRSARTVDESFDPMYIGARWDAQALSEGQSIMYSSTILFDALKPGSHEIIAEGEHAIVLIDELDSGLSLDNLDSVLRKIRTIVNKRDDVQIFMSFNTSYVLRYFPDVISLYDGQVHHIENETDMLKELKTFKKQLDKARKTSRGRYKIFD